MRTILGFGLGLISAADALIDEALTLILNLKISSGLTYPATYPDRSNINEINANPYPGGSCIGHQG
jgi:hypothetical protein